MAKAIVSSRSPRPTSPIKVTGRSPARAKRTAFVFPKGFAALVGDRVDGWFLMERGNILCGTMEGAFDVKSKFSETGKKRVYRIRVTAGGTKATTSDDDEITLGVGQLCGLDEKGWLKSLSEVENGREVYIRCEGKAAPSVEYPQGAWKFQVGVSTGEVE